MKWPLSHNNRAKEEAIDEHNQPTEPIARLVLPAYTPPTVQASLPFAEPTISTLPVQPFPQTPMIQQQVPVSPEVAQPQQAVPPIQAYHPYNPPVAASPYADVPALPSLPPLPVQPAQPQGVEIPQKGREKQSRLRQPMYVGLFFVAVQFLLLARFGIGMLNLPADNVWRDIIFTFSDVFLLPFSLLFRQVALPITIGLGAELYPLLAVLVYGIISRILVRLLKTVLRTQQARKA